MVYYSIFINQTSSATLLDMDDSEEDSENISELYPLIGVQILFLTMVIFSFYRLLLYKAVPTS